MRHLKVTLAALLLTPLLAGCSDGSAAPSSVDRSEPTTSPSTGPAATSTPTYPGETIPDGTFSKTVTRADAQALGIREKELLRSELGGDGEVTYTYRFAGDRWTLFGDYDGVPEVGDLGTLTYDSEGKVALTSEGEGCPGCVYTYEWRLNGNQLSMTLVGHDSTDRPDDLLAVRFVTEGSYTRQP